MSDRPLDDGIDVGYDKAFESVWMRVERGLSGALLLVLAAAAAGVLGRGGLSSREVPATGSSPGMRYERVLRAYAPAAIEIELPATRPAQPVMLRVRGALVDAARLTQLMPPPTATVLIAGGAEFHYAAGTGGARLVLTQRPDTIGVQRSEVQIDDAPPQRLDQLVLP